MVSLKSKREIELMREAARKLKQVLRELKPAVRAGVTTFEIDEKAERLVLEQGAKPAFKGYRGFPGSLCVSVNEEVVHGIPSRRILKDGDIVSLDVGINYEGYLSDAAITIPIGRIDSRLGELIEVTRNSLIEGIKQARINNQVSDISYAIQSYIEKKGFSVVRQFVGHGIGCNLHEEPQIPNFGVPHQGEILKKGMVLAIEPMVNMGTWECQIIDNGWTAVTKDGAPSAHFEHTVAITEKGPEILTN